MQSTNAARNQDLKYKRIFSTLRNLRAVTDICPKLRHVKLTQTNMIKENGVHFQTSLLLQTDGKLNKIRPKK